MNHILIQVNHLSFPPSRPDGAVNNCSNQASCNRNLQASSLGFFLRTVSNLNPLGSRMDSSNSSMVMGIGREWISDLCIYCSSYVGLCLPLAWVCCYMCVQNLRQRSEGRARHIASVLCHREKALAFYQNTDCSRFPAVEIPMPSFHLIDPGDIDVACILDIQSVLSKAEVLSTLKQALLPSISQHM